MRSVAPLFQSGHQRQYPAGQILLYQGESRRDIYYINSGIVKVYDISAKGEEKLLLLLSSGDMFPLIWTFKDKGSLLYFYEALGEVDVSVVTREQVEQEINQNHAFTIAMLRYFIDQTKELLNRLESIEGASAKHKVGQVLLYLAESHGKKVKDGSVIEPHLTHQLIAQMAGLARETVSIQMKYFEESKALKKQKNDKIVIHIEKLCELLEA